jgi:hypothetical protein
MNYPISIPTFKRGHQFKELSPKDGNYRNRYVTTEYIELFFEKPIIGPNEKITFGDDKGNVWLTITHKSIIISKDYAWNGCSPKKWWGFWWGTPDFEKTIIASLVHDALTQFVNTEHFPFTQYECDNIFKNILHQNNSKVEYIYYIGVRIGSNVIPNKKYIGKSVLTIELKD